MPNDPEPSAALTPPPESPGGEGAETSPASTSSTLALRSGYAVEAREGASQNLLLLKAPDGRICLTIRLLPEGPRVEIESESLAVSARGAIAIDCEELSIHARRDIALTAGGDLTQAADGAMRVRAEGPIETEGFSQTIRSRRGDVSVVANDDVTLDGERVRLNSPNLPRGRGPREVP
jgi:hypothetical protein